MTSSSTVTNLLKNVQLLNDAEFEDFFKKLLLLRESSRAGLISELELALLQQIHEGLPKEKQIRLNLLIAKRDAEIINDEEYEELLDLTAEIESLDLNRLKSMTQLAELRKITLPEVVELFNIRPITHD